MSSRGDAPVELIWEGKYRADGSRLPVTHRAATVRILEEVGDASDGRVFVGDNLALSSALALAEPGQLDLIYVDPPFATGQRFGAKRSVGANAEERIELPGYDDAWEGGLAGYLRMLDSRLRLMYELLAPHGSLYVHVDPNVGHSVKLLLDEVFGARCFQREIVWRIGWLSGFKTQARNWIRNHDLIFYYVKDPENFCFNKRYVPHPEGYRRRDGKPPRAAGVPLEDVWNANAAESALTGRESLDSIQIKSFSREKTGWATQKNESVLERIISASSNPGDRVADFFAGSGTTAAVCQRLGRRFLVADRSELAVQITRDRLLDQDASFTVCTLAEEAERALELLGREEAVARVLESCGAEGIEDTILAGRHAEVGLGVVLPGELLDRDRLQALVRAAESAGFVGLDIVASAFAPDLLRPSFSVGLMALTGALFDGRPDSVRPRPWVVARRDGEAVILERAEFCEHARLPDALRSSKEPLLGVESWRVVTPDSPTRCLARARRTAKDRSLAASLSVGVAGPVRVIVDDVLGGSSAVDLAGEP